jgi:hypothetical protein
VHDSDTISGGDGWDDGLGGVCAQAWVTVCE